MERPQVCRAVAETLTHENDTNLCHLVEGCAGGPRTERLFQATETDPTLLKPLSSLVTRAEVAQAQAAERGHDADSCRTPQGQARAADERESQDAHLTKGGRCEGASGTNSCVSSAGPI